MLEMLLFTLEGPPLMAASDMMDTYEGSLPPAATFQVVDLDNTETEPDE